MDTRNEKGEIPVRTWPGGYPVYSMTADGGILCGGPECANGPESKAAEAECPDDNQWLVVAVDIHWEGEPLICDHCGAAIESAYGDPEADES